VHAFVEVHEQIPGLLRDPGSGGVSGDAGQVDPSPLDLDPSWLTLVRTWAIVDAWT
jgi:hypothetical protein